MENTETNTGTTSAPPPRQYPAVDAFCLEVKRVLSALEPSPEVTQHFRNARIEMLKGLRQMIDNRIEALGRTEKTGSKITVE